MSYKTELMEQILTSKEAQTIIEYVSPIYGASYVGLWLFQVIGMELDDMLNWSEDLYNQVTPQTATWTIEYWESEYGITPNANLTLSERRQNIINKMRQRMQMNPKNIESLVSAILGVPVELQENTAKNTFSIIYEGEVSLDKLAKARAEVDKIKPAHLIYDLRNTVPKEVMVNTAAAVVMKTNKKYIVEVSE